MILSMTDLQAQKKYPIGNIAISNGEILFADNTTSVEEFEALHKDDITIIDGTGKLAMPGLINLHNHVSMTLMRSYADDMPLMPWLTEKIWPIEAKLTPDDVYVGAKLGIAEMLLGGTTTFADMYWDSDRVCDAVLESGIRAVVCPTFTDDKYDHFEKEAIEVIEKYHGADDGRLQIRLAPHAPYSCSPENIKSTLKVCAKYGIGVQIHVAETDVETQEIMQRYCKTPVEYLDSLGVFDFPTLAAHCIHLTDSDIEILRRKGVAAIHNPQSNMKLASGVSPVTKMLAAGVNVALGTDGTCSNNDLDMWDEMRSCSLLQKVTTGDPCSMPAYEVLKMATVNSAKALGEEGRLGVIAPGAKADVILLDIEKPHMYPHHDLVANLIYCAKSSDVSDVIVAGELLVDSGKLVREDIGALCRRAQSVTTRLVGSINQS